MNVFLTNNKKLNIFGGCMKKVIHSLSLSWGLMALLALSTTSCDPGVVGSIEGAVTMNGAPLEGISIQLTSDCGYQVAVTGADGKYAFTVTNYGKFYLAPQLSESFSQTHLPVPQSQRADISMAHPDVSGVDFEIVDAYHVCSGKVSMEGTPVAGVFIVVEGGVRFNYLRKTISTDQHGEYRIEGLKNDTYTLRPILKGYVFSPETVTVQVENTSQEGIDFEAALSSGGEVVWNAYYDTAEHGDSLEDLVGYAAITGDLIVENTSLTDLSLLSQLERAEKSLQIVGNPLLKNLEGLGNLAAVDTLLIQENNALTVLSGLDSLTSCHGVNIVDNDSLTSLGGFDNFVSVADISLAENDNLTSLSGMDRLESMDSLVIRENNNLTNLSGFNPIPSVKYVWIEENEKLASLKGIENFQYIEGVNIFHNNALTDVADLAGVNFSSLSITMNDALTNLNGIWANTPIAMGNLEICCNANLSDFSFLDHISSISGALSIYSQDKLVRLNNFRNLTSIGALRIGPGVPLTTLKDLDQLTTIDRTLRIQGAQITTMDGLNQLSSVGSIYLAGNQSLYTLEGLENLKQVENDIFILNNDALTSLEGLYTIESVGGDLEICLIDFYNIWSGSSQNMVNESLSQADVTNLVKHIGRSNIAGKVIIYQPYNMD